MTQTVNSPQRAQQQPDSAPSKEQDKVNRLNVFLHSVFFVLGFTVVFTLIGSAAGLLGRNLNYQLLEALQRFGAVLLFIFALVTLGVFAWIIRKISAATDLKENPAAAALVSVLSFFNGLLYTERRVTEMHKVKRGWGYASSAMLGVSFSAGWVPCVGPILASIFFLATDSTTVAKGATLLFIYSMGLGIPFLITGAALSSATKFLRRMNRHAHIISFISGIFLLYVAYLLWSGQLVSLTTQFSFLNEWVFQLEETLIGSSGTSGSVSGSSALGAAILAFTAGLISFLSPCVLPLVPAYVGYLSSAAVSGSDS